VLAKLSVLSLAGAAESMEDLAEAEPSEDIPGMASTSVAPWLAPWPRVVWGKGGARPVVPVASDEVDPVVMGTEVDLEPKSLVSVPIYELSFIHGGTVTHLGHREQQQLQSRSLIREEHQLQQSPLQGEDLDFRAKATRIRRKAKKKIRLVVSNADMKIDLRFSSGRIATPVSEAWPGRAPTPETCSPG
jgi:hypothetical protein